MILTLLGWLFITAVIAMAIGVIGTVIEIGYVTRDIWRKRK